ncbi:hypothetical protein Y1Q_0003248 [Alligator mississippiensis]|uniref:Uncharacterized protein n=1 Tax=Alligator mississippiensis TaxID=8496 RepID=A0A151ME00_ALLMI|nr:hypothetical protein Y1Q_0003248 [Alligator mississippiensis]
MQETYLDKESENLRLLVKQEVNSLEHQIRKCYGTKLLAAIAKGHRHKTLCSQASVGHEEQCLQMVSALEHRRTHLKRQESQVVRGNGSVFLPLQAEAGLWVEAKESAATCPALPKQQKNCSANLNTSSLGLHRHSGLVGFL